MQQHNSKRIRGRANSSVVWNVCICLNGNCTNHVPVPHLLQPPSRNQHPRVEMHCLWYENPHLASQWVDWLHVCGGRKWAVSNPILDCMRRKFSVVVAWWICTWFILQLIKTPDRYVNKIKLSDQNSPFECNLPSLMCETGHWLHLLPINTAKFIL